LTQHVIKNLLATLIARHAGEYSDPDKYVMTMISPIVSAFDEMKAEGHMADVGFEHGVSVCNEIETHALSLVHFDESEG